MVGILASFWEDLFSGSFAVSFREGNFRLDDDKPFTLKMVKLGNQAIKNGGWLDFRELLLSLPNPWKSLGPTTKHCEFPILPMGKPFGRLGLPGQ